MNNNNGLNIIDYYDPEAPESSEFRRLLHNINGSTAGGEKKSILVTSAMTSEGKSIISSFLAMTAVRHKNRKTLLIDFDLRRPTIHRLFGMQRDKGLAEILGEGMAARDAVKPTPLDKLDVLTAGKPIANPSDLISGPAVHKIIEEMKFYYDLIVIDSSPVIPVSDPILIIEEVDSALLVVKAGVTPKGVVTRACGLLSSSKGKLLGVVVNNLERSLPHYYDHSYYGYHYHPTKQ